MPSNFSSTGNFTLGGYHKYGSFTLNSGHTLYVGSSSYKYYGNAPPPNDPADYCVIIHCTGTCVINGHIDGYARGPFGLDEDTFRFHNHKLSYPPGYSQDGVLGGAGGNFHHYSRGNIFKSGVCPQSGATSPNMSANYTTALNYLMDHKHQWPFYVYGAGGAGHTYNDCWNPVRGGGGVWIQARRIIFNGSIDVRGANGTDKVWTGPWHNGNDCYAGGGGGGVIVMIAEQIYDNGTVQVNGGKRGHGCDTYSDPGGNGVKLVVTVPSQGIFHGIAI